MTHYDLKYGERHERIDWKNGDTYMTVGGGEEENVLFRVIKHGVGRMRSLQICMDKPSCFNCKHSDVSAGDAGSYWQPPEPPQLEECRAKHATMSFEEFVTLFDSHEWNEEVLPQHCGCYEPIRS